MKKFLVLVSMGVFLTSCATVVSGSKQSISITSNVEGASISLINMSSNKETPLGKTPFIGNAPRYKSAKLVIKKEGFKTAEILLGSETNWVFLAGAMSPYSGLSSTSTDFSTGAIYKYAPASYMANLEPAGSASNLKKFQKESSIRIFALLNYDRLCNDIAFGKGKYLDSVNDFYGAKDDAAKLNVLSFVKEAQVKSESVPDFAQRLSQRI